MSLANEAVYLHLGTKVWGNDTNNSSTFSNYLRSTNTRVGVPVTNFLDKIAKHTDASSQYTRTWNSYKIPYVTTSYKRTNTNPIKYGNSLFRDLGGLDSVSSAPKVDDVVRDIALKRLKGKLANDVAQFKALVPLGELKETYGLVRSTASVTEQFLKGLIELKRGRYRNIVKAASDAWLQYSFAIAPTINDVQSLFNSIAEYQLRMDIVKTYSGQNRKTWFEARAGQTISPGTVIYRANSLDIQYRLKYKYTAGVRMDMRSANNYGIQDHFGLLGSDIVPTLWELTPLSFVYDYFGTMGDYLSDVFQVNSGNTIYCTLSTLYTANVSQFFTKLPAAVNIVDVGSRPSFLLQRDFGRYERTVLGQLPHRSLRLKTADEIAANSVNRVLNLASLIFSKVDVDNNRSRLIRRGH